tara:strand:+ start:421 stop:792 length:372 start_codon:yes stop_codon:yes gene_type:complete
MSGFATIEGRRSPAPPQSVNILVRDHLNTEEKKLKAIAVNKIDIERLYGRSEQASDRLNELQGAMRSMAHEFDQRISNLENLVLPPPPHPVHNPSIRHGRQSPEGGGKRKKKKRRTRKKKRRN